MYMCEGTHVMIHVEGRGKHGVTSFLSHLFGSGDRIQVTRTMRQALYPHRCLADSLYFRSFWKASHYYLSEDMCIAKYALYVSHTVLTYIHTYFTSDNLSWYDWVQNKETTYIVLLISMYMFFSKQWISGVFTIFKIRMPYKVLPICISFFGPDFFSLQHSVLQLYPFHIHVKIYIIFLPRNLRHFTEGSLDPQQATM